MNDLDALSQITDAEAATWWCALNRWEWPANLPNPEPVSNGKNPRRSALMHAIHSRIGLKECLREWNKDGMPGKQFDVWWEHGRVLQ